MDKIDPVDVLARTLWAEARNQGIPGMTAVACVILNRAANPGWWGHDILSVCLAPQQFSCWNSSDPQHNAIRTVTTASASFRAALSIATGAVHAGLVDVTNGADHYCTKAVANKTSWARGRTPVYRCGTHLFYRIGLAG